MNMDPKHYAICLRGTWHMVTERKLHIPNAEGGQTTFVIKELWEKRPAKGELTCLPVLHCLGHTWDYVSRMH